MQTENLKRAIMSNAGYKEAFNSGKSLKPSKIDDFEETFSKESWVVKVTRGDSKHAGTMVFPRGSGQQIRGILFGSARPSLLIFDDLEDKETINNEEIRAARWTWFNGDAMKTIDRYSPDNYQVVYIDTVKHQDCMLLKLMESSDWTTLNLSACDENYKTLAPSYMTQVDLDELIRVAEEDGTDDVFAMEYMNEPISRKKASFKKEYFKSYAESDLKLAENPNIESVVILDPGKTVSNASDRTAIVCWGLDMSNGRKYVRDVDNGLFLPDEMYSRLFDMAVRNNARVIGYEKTGLNEFITTPLEEAMLRAGHQFELIPLNARQGQGEYSGKGKGKIGRIASLISYYRRGEIWHNEACCGPLEYQLLSFPKSRFWDVMDAAAYIVEMISLGGRLYCPAYKGGEDTIVKFSTKCTSENEYAALERQYEPVLEDAWMCA